MTNADYFIAKGEKPLPQDYANKRNNQHGVRIVLSDGCSGSPHSEVGAMLLCQIALEDFMSRLFAQEKIQFFLETLIRKAGGIANLIGVPSESINATFAMAMVDNEKLLNMLLFGDGYMFWKSGDGRTHITNVSYHMANRSIPYYLRYHYDNNLKNSYFAKNVKRNTSLYAFTNSKVDEHIHDSSSEVPFILRKMEWNEDLVFCGFASDGFSSFYAKRNGKKIFFDQIECATELYKCLDFPAFTGNFVQRNMIFHGERWEKEGTKFYDDLSIVVMGQTI